MLATFERVSDAFNTDMHRTGTRAHSTLHARIPISFLIKFIVARFICPTESDIIGQVDFGMDLIKCHSVLIISDEIAANSFI